MSYHVDSLFMCEVSYQTRHCYCPRRPSRIKGVLPQLPAKVRASKCELHLTDIKADVGMDVEIDDVPEQRHTPEQGKDVEMIEAPKEGLLLDELDS